MKLRRFASLILVSLFPNPANRLSGLPLRNRHLIFPEGFVVIDRVLDGHAANVDLVEVRRANSHRFGQQHHVVGVLECLIGRHQLLFGMVRGDLVKAVRSLMPSRTRIVAHGCHGNRIGIHAIPPDHQKSRFDGLGAQHPRTLSADGGDDRIVDRQVDRPCPNDVHQYPRQAPAFVAVRLGVQFCRRARGRLYLPVVEDRLSTAVKGRGRHAEHVLDGHGDAHLLVPLGLTDAHEEIAIFVRIGKAKGHEDMGITMSIMNMFGVTPISSCPLALPMLTKKSQSSYEWFSWKAGKMCGLVLTLKVEYCLPKPSPSVSSNSTSGAAFLSAATSHPPCNSLSSSLVSRLRPPALSKIRMRLAPSWPSTAVTAPTTLGCTQ